MTTTELTPNEQYYLHNTSPEAYKRLGEIMSASSAVHKPHLAMRGRYDQYPHLALSRCDVLFVHCVDCGRAHCTDGWLPEGYGSLYDRVRLEVREDPRNPIQSLKLYHCVVDQERCAEQARLRRSSK